MLVIEPIESFFIENVNILIGLSSLIEREVLIENISADTNSLRMSMVEVCVDLVWNELDVIT